MESVVRKILPSLSKFLAGGPLVVMPFDYVHSDVHPVTDHSLWRVFLQVVGNCPPTERVGAQ
jgi:hypothetical protein